MAECLCMLGDFHHEHIEKHKSLGEDKDGSDINIQRCRLCGQHWLTLEHEEPSFTGSALWYCLPVTTQEIEEITTENARSCFEASSWYWAGGPYFGSTRKRTGTLQIASWMGIS